MKRTVLPLLVLILLQSCKGQQIDNIINKYDNTDFSNLRGFSVHYRSTGHQNNTSIYFVDSYNCECPPYEVEFNDKNRTIVSINNKLVLKKCIQDYLSEEKITQVLMWYTQYKTVK